MLKLNYNFESFGLVVECGKSVKCYTKVIFISTLNAFYRSYCHLRRALYTRSNILSVIIYDNTIICQIKLCIMKNKDFIFIWNGTEEKYGQHLKMLKCKCKLM